MHKIGINKGHELELNYRGPGVLQRVTVKMFLPHKASRTETKVK